MKQISIKCTSSDELNLSYEKVRKYLDHIELWECSKGKNGHWDLRICVADEYEEVLKDELKK